MEAITEENLTEQTCLPEGVAEPEITAPAGLNIPSAEVFTPDTKDKADWVLAQIADRRARAARIRENAEIMARREEAEATYFEWRYGAALQDLARRELEGGKRKSLTLFHGKMGFRTKAAEVRIGDGKAALAWAKEHLPEAVVERVDKAALSKALLTDGEVVDFAAFLPAEEQFYIN